MDETQAGVVGEDRTEMGRVRGRVTEIEKSARGRGRKFQGRRLADANPQGLDDASKRCLLEICVGRRQAAARSASAIDR